MTKEKKEIKYPDGRIPPAVVIDIGRTLYGAYWQRSFAQAMKITERTLHRWSNDGCPITYAPALETIISGRMADIERLDKTLKEYAV